jgi:hypothetical protein
VELNLHYKQCFTKSVLVFTTYASKQRREETINGYTIIFKSHLSKNCSCFLFNADIQNYN